MPKVATKQIVAVSALGESSNAAGTPVSPSPEHERRILRVLNRMLYLLRSRHATSQGIALDIAIVAQGAHNAEQHALNAYARQRISACIRRGLGKHCTLMGWAYVNCPEYKTLVQYGRIRQAHEKLHLVRVAWIEDMARLQAEYVKTLPRTK